MKKFSWRVLFSKTLKKFGSVYNTCTTGIAENII